MDEPTFNIVQAANPRLFSAWSSPGHRPLAACPACGEDCSTTGITKLAYSFESCDCGTPEYVHLVEQIWHRSCFAAARGHLPVRG